MTFASKCPKDCEKGDSRSPFGGHFRCFRPPFSQTRKHRLDCAGVIGLQMRPSRMPSFFGFVFAPSCDSVPSAPPGPLFHGFCRFLCENGDPKGTLGMVREPCFSSLLAPGGPDAPQGLHNGTRGGAKSPKWSQSHQNDAQSLQNTSKMITKKTQRNQKKNQHSVLFFKHF